MQPSHPTEVAPALRIQARLILAEASDPEIRWQSEHVPRVWQRIARIIERAADECELVVKRYLDPAQMMGEEQFKMLSKALGSRGGEAERAARLVLVHGRQQSEVAGETGLTQQGVYAAVERYRRALLKMTNAMKTLE